MFFFADGRSGWPKNWSFSVDVINGGPLVSNKSIIEITNMLGNTTKQHGKSRTEEWVKIKGDARRTHNKSTQIKFETAVFEIPNNTMTDSGWFIVDLILQIMTKQKVKKKYK